MRAKSRKSSALAVAAAAGAAAAGVAYATLRRAASDPVPGSATALDLATLGDRILVIAPHPDDEIANAGGLMTMAQSAGARVKVVLLTVGDGYRRAARRLAGGPATPSSFLALGEVRAAETGAALDELGVPADDRVYLAYPDGGLESLWNLEWDPPRPQVGAGGERAVPYTFAYRPGAEYRGADLASDLARIIVEYEPTAVVHPDAMDRNHDHRAAATFCDHALRETRYHGIRLTYVAHRGAYPQPWARLPSAYLRPPRSLARSGLRWFSLPLPPEVVERKERALELFHSQMRIPDMRLYLLSFVRRNELFASRYFPPATPSDT